MLRDNKITFKSNDRFGGFEVVIEQPERGSGHSQRRTARGGQPEGGSDCAEATSD
jgi:hypothetical protein